MASEKYAYVLTELAEADIDEIIEFIASDLANLAAASDFANELEEKLDGLRRAPKSGRLVENEFLKRDDVRRILVGNFTAYYIIDDLKNLIIVLRVVCSKRDLDKILKEI